MHVFQRNGIQKVSDFGAAITRSMNVDNRLMPRQLQSRNWVVAVVEVLNELVGADHNDRPQIVNSRLLYR